MNSLEKEYKNSKTTLLQLQLSVEILSIQKTYYTILTMSKLLDDVYPKVCILISKT